MTEDGLFRRRHLPHWDVEGHPYFVTACLDRSLSAVGLKRIRTYREELDARPRPAQLSGEEWETRKSKLVFALVDKLLDHESPVKHLADPAQAQIVQNAFLHFANERYKLLAFVVMPSHHHWLFLPNPDWAVQAVQKSKRDGGRDRTAREIISHSVQSFTANMCNRVRGESGPYWQAETFDHWARDEEEILRIIDYIERNPVAAGLVSNPEDWPWSSASLRKKIGVGRGEALFKPK